MSSVSEHFIHAQHEKQTSEEAQSEIEAGRTVFVIEDDESARTAISQLLQHRLGLQVAVFSSAEDFLAHYDGSAGGCIVSDFQVTDMNGLDFQLRLNTQEIHLPLIFVSGCADVDVAVSVMRNGALTLLLKPWDDEELVGAVREAIELEVRWRRERAHRQSAQRRLGLLTSQEREVVEMVISGKSNKQISYALDVSLRTIERRRQSIFTKTSTATAVELANLCRQAGNEDEETTV